MLSETLSSNRLLDVDWSFGVTAATDESDYVGRTYLQLKLTIDHEGSGPTDVFMELSIEQFYHFLAQMEKCKVYLDFMTTESV